MDNRFKSILSKLIPFGIYMQPNHGRGPAVNQGSCVCTSGCFFLKPMIVYDNDIQILLTPEKGCINNITDILKKSLSGWNILKIFALSLSHFIQNIEGLKRPRSRVTVTSVFRLNVSFSGSAPPIMRATLSLASHFSSSRRRHLTKFKLKSNFL